MDPASVRETVTFVLVCDLLKSVRRVGKSRGRRDVDRGGTGLVDGLRVHLSTPPEAPEHRDRDRQRENDGERSLSMTS